MTEMKIGTRKSLLALTQTEIASEKIKGLFENAHVELEKISTKGDERLDRELKSFGGKKTVVTPGLVELGILDHEENAALGAKLVGFDRVILVGDTLVGYIREGYLGAGGDPEKLTVVPTLFKAEELLSGNLKKGDAVLFLNDLPDVYK